MATLDTVVIKIVGDTTGVEKTIDTLKKIGKVDKENADAFEAAAKKRAFLLDRASKRLQKLQIDRQKAFNPKDIKRFNDRIAETVKDVELLGGEVVDLGKKTNTLGSSIGKFGKIVLGAFAVRAIVNFGKELFELAVESEAFEKRAQKVFGNSIDIVEEFASRSANSLGLTEVGFLGAAAAIGDILVPLGLSRERAAEMSIEAVKLGGALKQFTGDSRSAAEISNIVARSLTGELEGLKTLGVVVDQTSVKFKDLVKSKIVDLGLTDQQAKAETIFQLALEGSRDALEEFENNTDSLARQQAIFNAQSEELKETLAELLTPSFLSVTKAANEFFGTFKDANEDLNFFEKTLIAVAKATGVVPGFLLAGAFTDKNKVIEKTTEDLEDNLETIKEQIRNAFFLRNQIKELREEQQAQGTSLQRITEINRELIPIQKELNTLLGKDKASDPVALLSKRINELRNELLNQALAGEISKESLLEYEKAVRKAEKANQDLRFALERSFDFETLEMIKASKVELEKFEDVAIDVNDAIKQLEPSLFKALLLLQIFFEENEDLINSSIEAEQSLFRIISTINEGKLIQIENERKAAIGSLDEQRDKKIITEEEFQKRRSELNETADRERAIILRRQAIADKTAAIIQATISGAVATVKALETSIPLALIVGGLAAVEIGVIAAQPIPEFHEGKRAELGSGEIFAKIRDDEYVIDPEQSKKHKGILDAVLDKRLSTYVFEKYQMPIIKQFTQKSSNPFDDIKLWSNQRKQIKLTRETNHLLRNMKINYNSRRSWN